MKTKDVVGLFPSLSGLVAVFAKGGIKISKSAISQWPRQVPELRRFQLRDLIPDIDERIAKLKTGRKGPSVARTRARESGRHA